MGNGFNPTNVTSNLQITVGPDQRYWAIGSSGFVLNSDKLLGTYQALGPSIYPSIAGMNNGNAEDPIIWYSGGYYHVVYNYWDARKAYHLMSVYGIHNWINTGVALDRSTDFIRYTDGTVNHWGNMERPNVYMENGHVTYFTFAVTDQNKDQSSNCCSTGSKVIVVPFDGEAFDADNAGTGGSGGTTSTGGSSSIGGSAATGGARSTGGTSGLGGSAATGGRSATGGVVSTGGFPNTGGTTNVAYTGGATAIVATGGRVPTGGAQSATGGVLSASGGLLSAGGSGGATGGQFALGGANATGGMLASGGHLNTASTQTTAPNAGTTTTDSTSTSGGCGCRVTAAPSKSNVLAALGVLGVLLLRARRRGTRANLDS